MSQVKYEKPNGTVVEVTDNAANTAYAKEKGWKSKGKVTVKEEEAEK